VHFRTIFIYNHNAFFFKVLTTYFVIYTEKMLQTSSPHNIWDEHKQAEEVDSIQLWKNSAQFNFLFFLLFYNCYELFCFIFYIIIYCCDQSLLSSLFVYFVFSTFNIVYFDSLLLFFFVHFIFKYRWNRTSQRHWGM
jgi:hypothetical protein